jgi:hypothetical protein
MLQLPFLKELPKRYLQIPPLQIPLTTSTRIFIVRKRITMPITPSPKTKKNDPEPEGNVRNGCYSFIGK